ncbi:MAG: DUF2207 domain-containing protein, partial [Candidatus Micrarchaeia archaeon]
MERKMLFAIVFVALALSGVAFSASGSYSIPRASVDYYLNQDGTIYVKENITYVLDGTFRELYVQKPPDLAIVNASGYCEQKECEFYTQMNGGWRELVLKSDYSYETVNAVFTYTLEGEVLEQKDCAQFFYKLWGDQWTEGVGELKATVHVPGDTDKVEYFVHPPILGITNTTGANYVGLISNNHPSGIILEINLVMPKEWFSNMRKAPNYMSKTEIVEGEKKYIEETKLKGIVYRVFYYGLALGLPLAFILLYLIYGRETALSQLQYVAPYEREPPGDLSPAEASYLLSRKAEPNSISGEMLWLVQQEYLRMEEKEVEVGFLFKSKKKTVVFYLNEGKNLESLKSHQRALYDFISGRRGQEGYFSVEYGMASGVSKQIYSVFYRRFQKEVEDGFKKRGYMNETGSNIFLGLCVFGFISAILGFVL